MQCFLLILPLKWLKDDEYADKIFENVGGFAYSVKNKQDVDNLVFALKGRKNISSFRISLQHIMGSIPDWEFEDLCEAAEYHNLKLTLLGYKGVGRGKNLKPYKFNWISIVKKHHICISIDTSLAKENEEELKEKKVSDLLYETEEGKFSMYIDAVGKKVGPSSFCDEDKMIPFEKMSGGFIRDQFAKF